MSSRFSRNIQHFKEPGDTEPLNTNVPGDFVMDQNHAWIRVGNKYKTLTKSITQLISKDPNYLDIVVDNDNRVAYFYPKIPIKDIISDDGYIIISKDADGKVHIKLNPNNLPSGSGGSTTIQKLISKDPDLLTIETDAAENTSYFTPKVPVKDVLSDNDYITITKDSDGKIHLKFDSNKIPSNPGTPVAPGTPVEANDRPYIEDGQVFILNNYTADESKRKWGSLPNTNYTLNYSSLQPIDLNGQVLSNEYVIDNPPRAGLYFMKGYTFKYNMPYYKNDINPIIGTIDLSVVNYLPYYTNVNINFASELRIINSQANAATSFESFNYVTNDLLKMDHITPHYGTVKGQLHGKEINKDNIPLYYTFNLILDQYLLKNLQSSYPKSRYTYFCPVIISTNLYGLISNYKFNFQL